MGLIILDRVKILSEFALKGKPKDGFYINKSIFFKNLYKLIFRQSIRGTRGFFWRTNPHFNIGGYVREKNKLSPNLYN